MPEARLSQTSPMLTIPHFMLARQRCVTPQLYTSAQLMKVITAFEICWFVEFAWGPFRVSGAEFDSQLLLLLFRVIRPGLTVINYPQAAE